MIPGASSRERVRVSDDVFIIAEAGVNHNGDVATALEMIEVAAAAGADAVKFQTFRADALVTSTVGRPEYQSRNLGADGSQAAMLRAVELPDESYALLSARACDAGVEFMSTAFDEASLDFLIDEVGIGRIKIPSGELTNTPFLVRCAQRRLPMLVSTGMATMDEVRLALDAIAFGLLHESDPRSLDDMLGCSAGSSGQHALAESVILLHCTSDYPTAPEDANLRAMLSLRSEFGVEVGYSDHTLGIEMSVSATALGASAVEKHFTLSRTMAGPDHSASLEPGELAELVRAIRAVSAGLGSGRKEPTDAERRVAPLVRKVLVASRAIGAGQVLGPDDVVAKRAGEGVSPHRYWELLGTRAPRDYDVDDVLEVPSS